MNRPRPRGIRREIPRTPAPAPVAEAPRFAIRPAPPSKYHWTRRPKQTRNSPVQQRVEPTREERDIKEKIDRVEASIRESQRHTRHASQTVSRAWVVQLKNQQEALQNLKVNLSKLHTEQNLKEGIQTLISETVLACRQTLQHKDLPRINQTLAMVEELIALLRLNKMPELRKWETLYGILQEVQSVNQLNSNILRLLQTVATEKGVVDQLEVAVRGLMEEKADLQRQLSEKESTLSKTQKEFSAAKLRHKASDDALQANQRKAKQEADRAWARLQRELAGVTPTRRKR